MPEPTILLCGPALDAEESAVSLERLRGVTLPNATKFLVTTGKFDSDGSAKSVNVEADYPAETAYLQTLLRWSGNADLGDPRYRDGYDLYCLQRILARFKKFDYAVVLRAGTESFQQRWRDLTQAAEGQAFLTFEGGEAPHKVNILINLKDGRCRPFMEAAWELFRTGAVYGMQSYSLDAALRIALESVEIDERPRKAPRKTKPTPEAEAAGDSPAAPSQYQRIASQIE